MSRVRWLASLAAVLLALAPGTAAAASTSGLEHSIIAIASEPESSVPLITCSSLPTEARRTLELIESNGPFPYPKKDGSPFKNNPNLAGQVVLPVRSFPYYSEYTVEDPDAEDRGAKRIVTGKKGERYYTEDHYQTFKEIVDDPPPSNGAGPSCPRDPHPRPRTGGAAAAEPAPEESDHEVLSAPNSGDTAQGALADSVSGDADPGGIDFSSLTLRYLSDGSTGTPTRYAFSASPAGPTGSSGSGTAATQRASDAFFVWLSLRPDTFWVNMKPSQPDRVTDPGLGRTDVGRVLLDADLELKRSMSRLNRPNTPTGDRFWRTPGALDFLRYCSVTRAWIVPGPARVREDGDAVYVEDAPLVVRTEPGDVGAAAGACTPPPPDVAAHEDALTREVVLPEMQREVNEEPRYAALRQVYYARVAAEWYRQRSATRHTEFGSLIDRGDVSPWALHTTWTPQQEFTQYQQSFYQGDYRDDLVVGDTVHTIVQGGVDLTTVPLAPDTAPAPAGLSESVQQSFRAPTRDPSGQYWLGAVTQAPPPGPSWTLIGLGSSTVLIAALGSGVWWRRRRLDGGRPGWGDSGGRALVSAEGALGDPHETAPTTAGSTPGYGPDTGDSPRYGRGATGTGTPSAYGNRSADPGRSSGYGRGAPGSAGPNRPRNTGSGYGRGRTDPRM